MNVLRNFNTFAKKFDEYNGERFAISFKINHNRLKERKKAKMKIE